MIIRLWRLSCRGEKIGVIERLTGNPGGETVGLFLLVIWFFCGDIVGRI